jgi:putative hydrolase of HD superfamily
MATDEERNASARERFLTMSTETTNDRFASALTLPSAPQHPSIMIKAAKADIDFFMVYGKLKATKRTGWTRFEPLRFSPTDDKTGVELPRVESVADHSARLAIMGLLNKEPGCDAGKIVKMSLVHDLAEATVGDITPESDSGISRAEKIKLEKEAMTQILMNLSSGGSPLPASEIRSLWEEYEAGETDDAKFVKDCDRIEMILQAFEYEQACDVDLSTFFETTRGKARLAQTKVWDGEVRRRRDEWLAGKKK